MLILSLDTTTPAGSLAVVEDGRVSVEISGDASLTHGQRLPGEIVRTLETAGVRLEDLHLFAVAAGPGSFTGLRVGIATIQGLAFATGRRVVPISTLDALGRGGENTVAPVGAWIDAQRGQVFAALYDASGGSVLVSPTARTPPETLAAWAAAGHAGPIRFIGDGAVRYLGVIRERLGSNADIVEPPPLAGVIGRMASQAPGLAVLPHAIVPVYVRRPDAELARRVESAGPTSQRTDGYQIPSRRADGTQGPADGD